MFHEVSLQIRYRRHNRCDNWMNLLPFQKGERRVPSIGKTVKEQVIGLLYPYNSFAVCQTYRQGPEIDPSPQFFEKQTADPEGLQRVDHCKVFRFHSSQKKRLYVPMNLISGLPVHREQYCAPSGI